MKYAVEMGSGAMIYIPSFIKIGSGIQKIIEGGLTDTQTAWIAHKPSFICQNKERRLKVDFLPVILHRHKAADAIQT
jgi:hypothetical protein